MPKEALEIQFAMPGAPTLLEICQRLMSAARGSSDPLPDVEFDQCIEVLRRATTYWVDNDDPFDNGVLALVRITLMRTSPVFDERVELYTATLDALSDARDAVTRRPATGLLTVEHSSSLHDRILAGFHTPESRHTAAQIYEKIDVEDMTTLRAALSELEAAGTLSKVYSVKGRWSGCGLEDFARREDVPDTMEDEWLDEPLEFAVGDGDIVEWYGRP